MAIETINQQGFNTLPAPPGTLGPIRIIDGSTKQVRVTTTGAAFTLEIFISNAINNSVPDHLFLPPAESFELAATVTEPSLPVTIDGPMRFMRVRVASGTVNTCTLTEAGYADPPDGLSETDVRQLIAQNLVLYDTETIQIAGLSITGDVLRIAGDAATGTDSVTIGGQTITGNTIGVA